MDLFLNDQLIRTLFVHYPLEVEETKGMEAKLMEREVDKEIILWNGENVDDWSSVGIGNMEIDNEIIHIRTNSREEFWPETENQNGIYSTFGDYTVCLDLHGMDLSEFNQIYFEMKSDCDGLHSPMVRVGFENEGRVKIPDIYSREGFHAVALENGRWCQRIWTISEIPHDKVTKLFFRIHKYGKELTASDEMRFELKNIRMQKVKKTQVTKGWMCERDTISFSTSGYWSFGKKIAVANIEAQSFCLADARNGEIKLKQKIRYITFTEKKFAILDFSDFQEEGEYKLQVGEVETEAFPIGKNIMESAVWRVLNFLFCERCGFPVPGKHGTCHQDVYVEHDDIKMVYSGGWHDAADVSQQTVQTAEIVHALMECASQIDHNEPLYLRLMEEAGWGMDFVLRTRLGNGYRATSAGHRRWTDNLLGNFDDVLGRCHQNAFDNFIIAGIEAYGAKMFLEQDRELAWKCGMVATEDFDFAETVFNEKGILRPSTGEHTYNASLSQHYAAAAWAAASIYEINQNKSMKQKAVFYLDKLLKCQDHGETKTGLSGFFYRDEEHKTVVHFSHQSREHLFAQALTKGIEVFADCEEAQKWREAMRSYGMYFKGLMQYASPYGMLPSGLYNIEEIDDPITFDLIHPRLDFQKERENYKQQLENGIRIGEKYYIRQFPVWFSYRGNNAIMLSMGKSVSLLGKALKDEQLMDIARDQVYWIAGKNPFGSSFIYGEGSNYGRQYNALAGEMVGEMPVGTQTQGNEDIPYYPMGNIACYREVWTTVAGRWLWVVADLY